MLPGTRLAVSFALFATAVLAQEEPPRPPAAADPAPAPTTAVAVPLPGRAPAEPEALPKTAPNRVTAVTVYQGNALVTREVAVPEGKGLVELVVTPLPAQTLEGSLYTEGTDGIRVLSTRYRSRAVKEDTRAEVRAKEEQIKTLQAEAKAMQKEIEVIGQNLQMLAKLEGFTAATMQQLAEKGMLNGETTIALTKYVMQTRAEQSAAQVELEQKLQANAEAVAFASRQLAELSAGASRTDRDAVIVVDKADAAAGTVLLNYLVNAATWHPQYRLRAGTEKDPVQLEYLGAIEQQSGEDWDAVAMTLSTAQPMLNATPPDLQAIDITVTGSGPGGGPGGGGGMGGMGGGLLLGAQNREQSRALRLQAQQELNGNNFQVGGAIINDAAALEQTQELLAGQKDEEALGKSAAVTVSREGPTVTYHLKSKLTVPSRTDQQLIEVARIEMAPDYFYKAVPVLTSHVYRLANLTNASEHILLPGEATMYVGSDFVGRMNLPLVAIGERFTAGFGVDPQLQVGRQLIKKTRTIQGGNQVHNYDYRITVNSYKAAPVTLQVWDRMPRAEAEAVGVTLIEATPKTSEDPTYLRVEKPDNLLRWDLAVKPGTHGEKAETVAYQFRLEYARDVAIGNFKALKR